jgi:transposase InsO family protein
MPAISSLELIPRLQINQVGTNPISEKSLIEQNPDVFSGLGNFGNPVELVLKDTAVPRQVPARVVPQNMRGKLYKELSRLEQSNVIVKDKDKEPAQWISPLVLVNKPNGDLRLCLDPQYLNTQLVRAHSAIPTTTEIFSRISGSKFFTTLDAKQGFHQIRLDDKSSKLTSFITPYGKFRYTRLPMGICNAPEIFHQRMIDVFASLPGVEIYIDDILVHAATFEEHSRRLQLVLDKCREVGLTLNPDKVILAKSNINYLGHELSAQGVRPSCSKVEAVEKMLVPTDKKAVQRFLGFVNYLAKFIPHLSEHTYPLRQISKVHTQFYWGVEQSEAFEKIKSLISEAPTLMLYDPKVEVTLTADSSSHSIGAVALQEGRPLEFAAKSLTECQQRYSQIEKELLATLFVCKKFKYYTLGQVRILVETDHLPLIGLLKKDINTLSPRLAAMCLELLSYPVELKYRPGPEMVLADTLSRACLDGTQQCDDLASDPLVSVCSVVIRSEDTMSKYQKATADDEELPVVMRYIQEGWPAQKKSCAQRALPYWNLRHSLSCLDGVIFYGSRLVIPVSLRAEVVESLHSAHQGVTKTLQRARESVFWPGLKLRIEEKCLSCLPCQVAEGEQNKEPLMPYPIPPYPFHTVGVDLMMVDQKSYLVLVDYLAKWSVVRVLEANNSSRTVINALREVFSDFGTPEIVISDNGPQFSSGEFKQFCRAESITHNTSSPLHPSGNGQVERTIGTVKNMIKKCSDEGSDWFKGLKTLRNTPVADGIPCPAELLQGRVLHDNMPVTVDKYKVHSYDLELVRDSLSHRKNSDKFYHDRRASPDKARLVPGDQVHFKAANGQWKPGKIDQVLGDRSYTVKTTHCTVRRNRKDLRPSQVSYPSAPTTNIPTNTEACPGASSDKTSTDNATTSSQVPTDIAASENIPTSRFGRKLNKPIWHKDYQM